MQVVCRPVERVDDPLILTGLVPAGAVTTFFGQDVMFRIRAAKQTGNLAFCLVVDFTDEIVSLFCVPGKGVHSFQIAGNDFSRLACSSDCSM